MTLGYSNTTKEFFKQNRFFHQPVKISWYLKNMAVKWPVDRGSKAAGNHVCRQHRAGGCLCGSDESRMGRKKKRLAGIFFSHFAVQNLAGFRRAGKMPQAKSGLNWAQSGFSG
jgi:hypothetical protein